MGEFEKLYDVAQAVNQDEFVRRIENVAEAVAQQKFVNVVVTGTRNSGKTTFINRVVGSEVSEAGKMDDEEKPLRVSFEPLPENENFQCILAENEPWREKSVVLYELRENDLLDGNALKAENYPFDLVFFLISATAPFRLDDLNFLKAMPLLQRRVVVNGLSYVPEDEREKVLKYIDRINAANGFPPVIILDDSKELGEKVLAVIPSGSELQELRAKKYSAIFNYTLEQLRQTIQSKIAENAAARDFAANNFSAATENKKIAIRLGELRADAMKYKNSSTASCLENLDGHFATVAAKILSVAEKSKLKDAEIQRLAEEEYVSAGKAVLEKLQEKFFEDLQRISSSARVLGVANLRERVEARLNQISVETMSPSSPFVRITSDTEKNSGKGKSILISAGILASGLILSPLPTVASVAGSVIAAAGAGVLYGKNKNAEREQTLAINLKSAFMQGADNIKTTALNGAEKCYGEIIAQLQQEEENLLSAKPNLTPYDENAARLNTLLDTLKNI